MSISPRSSAIPRHSRGRDTNPATNWTHRAGFKLIYVIMIVGVFVFVRICLPPSVDNGIVMTIVLTLHNLISFVLLHWSKGSPEIANILVDDANLSQTFWEQLEGGVLGTPTRRFFCVMPIILFFIALVFNINHDDLGTLLFNTASTLTVLLPKAEFMFGVRLFGINAD